MSEVVGQSGLRIDDELDLYEGILHRWTRQTCTFLGLPCPVAPVFQLGSAKLIFESSFGKIPLRRFAGGPPVEDLG